MSGTWTLPDGSTLELEITTGKPLDVLALKGSSLDDVREYAAGLALTAAALYPEGGPRRRVDHCPCCGEPTTGAVEALVIYGVAYRRCGRCGHGFVAERPAGDALDAHFAESEELSETYIDPAATEARLEQVVMPKLDWTLREFRRNHGGVPARAIDVGAGGGHFVAGAQRAGLPAVGYEISRASRTFARQSFGIDLLADDFLAADEDADLVTFWGLLEYTPEPREFLEAARRALRADGLLVVEVPRFDCLGTAVQARFSDTVARHLDPTSHVNCFSDTSLAAALVATGFRPVAAWYFGMDAYELSVQLAMRLGDEMLAPLVEHLLPLQGSLDEARYCDDLVVAALPV